MCSGLEKSLRRREILSGVTFSVPSGSVVGFLGPNGAGKTTTIRCLLGLSKMGAGQAWILGARVSAPKPVLSRVGSMIDEPRFYPWMSGRRNLQVLSARPRREVEATLERVGLGESGARRAGEYSQGMRQRLSLGLALIGGPELLILDEPANGLDPAGTRDFRRIIRGFADRGGTVLLSSHQLTEVERACDSVVVIAGGRTIIEGSLSELTGTAGAVRVTVHPSETDRAVVALTGLEVRRSEPGELLVLGAGSDVARRLADEGIYPAAIRPEEVSLEERFLQLTELGAAS